MKKKLIGIVSSFAHPHQGGVEVYSWELAKKMEQDGHQVVLISLNTETRQTEEKVDGILFYRLPCITLLNGKFPIPKFSHEYWSTLSKIRSIDFDLLFLNVRFYPLSLIFAKLAHKKRIPALLVEHGTGHFKFSNSLFNKLGEIYEHAITACIKKTNVDFYGVSGASLQWLEHFNIHGKGTIYNGVNTSWPINRKLDFLPSTNFPNELRICFVGRLIEEKGLPQLILAIDELHAIHPGLKLYIAGDGPLKNQLPKSVDFIQYLGRLSREEVFLLFSNCDVMVLPSRFPEGLPTTILEAGSQACTVIATAMGGTREVIINDEYGMIIPDGSAVSIKAALTTLLENPAIRENMGQKLQERVRNFYDWEVIYQKFSKEVLDSLD